MALIPVKYVYKLSDERCGPDSGTSVLSVSIVHGVVPRSELTDKESRADDLSGYKSVRKGDVVINRMRAFQGALGIAPQPGVVSPEYIVLRPLPSAEARFLAYLFKSTWFVAQMTSRLRGIGGTEQGNVRTPRINPDDLGGIPVDLPALDLQVIIADYLDGETVRIDALIEKKRRMVALLDERRTSIIGAVVEGSGPCVAVRFMTSRITSGPRGWSDLAADTGTAFIRITNVQRRSIELDMTDTLLVAAPSEAESRRTEVREGDVLVSITADIGSVAVARDAQVGAHVSQHLALLTPDGCRSDWLAYAIKSPRCRATLDAGQYGGTKTQLGLGDIASLCIPRPSLDDQDRLLKTLNAEIERIGMLSTRLGDQIDLLVEHRQALITAAVTGELEIPGVAA